MQSTFPSVPDLPDNEKAWALQSSALVSSALPLWPDALREYAEGGEARLPWAAPVWNAGKDGMDFVPGLPRRHAIFWDQMVLKDHPDRDQFLSFIRDGVGLYDLLLPSHRGPSVDRPYNEDRFRGLVMQNRIPPGFDGFVADELKTLLNRGCVARWDDVKTASAPARPRMIMALSVETGKPRLIYDARPLNRFILRKPFHMDPLGRVAYVGSQGCYMTSLDDCSAFHHLLIRPSSWTLFGFSYRGVDYVFCVLPFGFCASPWVYHTLSEAKAAFLRKREIPALAYLDDSFLTNYIATHGKLPKEQWLAAADATHVAMLVSYFCGYFLSLKKCDLRPTTLQKYLGMWCDSVSATFRVPQERLDKMHARIELALESGSISFPDLQSIAGQAMSMSAAIRPASLYTQAMFAGLSTLEKSGLPAVDLKLHSSANLLGELTRWLDIASTTHEGPWQRARHYNARLTGGSSDASSPAWGGIMYAVAPPFMAGGVFPQEWLPKHINQKEMYALYHLLLQFCDRHPDALRRAQVSIDVDNEAVVGAFNRGRAKNRDAHDLLIQLFDLQVSHEFMLLLKWIPTAENGVADAISRPSRDELIRLKQEAFEIVWDALGPFNIDWMACSASVQRSPVTGEPLPFFSRYDCAGSAGVDMLAHDVAVLPGSQESARGFVFPAPVMAGHVVQHLLECRARGVLLLPDIHAYWFPALQQATVRSVEVAPRGATGFFHWPTPAGSLNAWCYRRWAMRAVEVDFSGS